MSQVRKRQRNNTIAGLFVLFTLVAFVLVVIVLSDMSGFGRKQRIEIRFPTEIGAPGLNPGADVLIAGVPKGKVEAIHLELADDPSIGPFVRVIITLPDSFTVRRDAEAGLMVPVIGSGAWINLEGLGTGEPLGPDEYLEGGYAPSAILRSAGLGQKQIEEMQRILANIDALSANTAEITRFAREQIDEHGDEIVESIRGTIDQAERFVQSVREEWDRWRGVMTQALENAQQVTENAGTLINEGRSFIANVDEGVTNVRRTFDEITPQVKRTASNVEAVTNRARGEWSDRISEILARTNDGVQRAQATLTTLDDSLTTALPEVKRILANMRLASDNLKLAMIEIRNEPWRLLASPSERAVRETVLYDAVRSYANAVSDLDASIAALKALHDRYGEDFDPEREAVQRVLNLIEEHHDRYVEADELLYQFVLQETGGAPGESSGSSSGASGGSEK